MRASVLHDEQGEIIAISKIVDPQASGSKFASAGMVPAPGQTLLEVELAADDADRPLRELHQRYRVDASAAKLVKR
jgi:hypothetical protein